MVKGNDRLPMLFANLVRDLSQLHMITDMILKLLSRFEGYGVHDEMIMNIVRIQMGRYKNLIVGSPHYSCSRYPNAVGFLRCNLSCFEALKSMVSYIPT